MMRLLTAAIGFLLAAAAITGHSDPDREQAVSANPSLSVIAKAPAFTLRDPNGRTVRLADYRGQVVLLAFVFTTCPGVCPLISKQMSALQESLKAEGLFGGTSTQCSGSPAMTAAQRLRGLPCGWSSSTATV